MSEKPFWEGKTCKELEGLRVKITWDNGDTLTSTLNLFGNAGQCELSPARHPAATFVPYADIKSIELLDDPEYERIDNLDDVREGDVYVATDGNRYTVLRRTTSNLNPLTVAVINTTFYPHRSYFGYALRPTPKLPDHDGLWLDKDDAIWQVYDHQAIPVYDDADGWGVQREIFSVSQLGQYAPFRPAKAVEA